MISNNYLSALNKSLERQSKIQEQLTDGKAIHRPSDDPIKAIRSLRFNTNLSMNEQFTQNVNDSISWMETTDGAMSNLSNIMIRVKELAVSADGNKPADALNAIGAEIDQLINQAVSIGNTKIGDRYVFAGQMDGTLPFERKQITDPQSNKTMDVVVYNGDLNKISMLIKPGVTNPSEDSVNITGEELFGPLVYKYGNATDPGVPTMDIFSQLISLKEELQKKSSITQTTSTAGAATIGGAYPAGAPYTNYDVKIDSVNGSNQVTGASYSMDGGNSWTALLVADVTAGNPSVINNLPNGVTLSIATAAGNAVSGTTYSFHMPTSTNNNPDTSWVSNVALGNIDRAHSAQLKMHTELGARMSTYEMVKNILASNNATITNDVSQNEDLDIAAAIIDQKTSENVYKAALSVGAKIMPLSLVDFMR